MSVQLHNEYYPEAILEQLRQLEQQSVGTASPPYFLASSAARAKGPLASTRLPAAKPSSKARRLTFSGASGVGMIAFMITLPRRRRRA